MLLLKEICGLIEGCCLCRMISQQHCLLLQKTLSSSVAGLLPAVFAIRRVLMLWCLQYCTESAAYVLVWAVCLLETPKKGRLRFGWFSFLFLQPAQCPRVYFYFPYNPEGTGVTSCPVFSLHVQRKFPKLWNETLLVVKVLSNFLTMCTGWKSLRKFSWLHPFL